MKHAFLERTPSGLTLLAPFLLGMTMAPSAGYSQVTSPSGVEEFSSEVDFGSSAVARISDVPPEIVERHAERGVVLTTHHLSDEERQKLLAALEVLTPLHQTILAEHLRSISFAEDLPANAQTVRVGSGSPEAMFDLVVNARVLDETVSDFATRREMEMFDVGDSRLTVSVVAGSMDAIAFVLAHEATHIVDFVIGLSPPPTPPGVPIPEANQTPFARAVWEGAMTPVSTYRGGVLESIPLRTGTPLSVEKAQELYEDLERTPFASVYASLMVVEDIAELVAWRQITEIFGQPYRIEVRDDAGVIYAYEPMRSTVVRGRLSLLDLFDSPEIAEP